MDEQKDNLNTTVPVVDIEKQKQERENKLKGFWKKPIIFLPILILLIILGVYIRYQPLTDHGNGIPGLWDIATNKFTLGPDLDPFLFLRYAKTIDENGSMPIMDSMRYAPIGFPSAAETNLLPQLIVYTKHIISSFLGLIGPNNLNFEKYKTIEYAADLFPVIMFALTIIAFFLFIYSIFSGNGKEENSHRKKMFAYSIASIATLFMIIIPSFLARTVAGIPEKESAGFFFLFISLYLFIRTLRAEKIYFILLFGFLSGLTTVMMDLIWGGVVYIYVTIAITCLMALILNKLDIKQKIGFAAWFSSSIIFLEMFNPSFSLIAFITSLDTGLSSLVFGIISLSIFIDQLKKRNLEKYIGLTWIKEKTKLPENIIVIIIALLLMLIVASIIIGPSFILNKVSDINKILFNPLNNGRWSTTVAENQQPYFTSWLGTFGFYAFWIFVIGSIVFFWDFLSDSFEKKERIKMTCLYGLFFCGLVFSRYAPHPALLDGENFISKLFYLLTATLFFGGLIYYYIKGERIGKNLFDKLDTSWILLFVLFILSLFTARSAVRLIMVLAIIAPIFIAYLICKIGTLAIWGEKNKKIFYWLIFSMLLISMIYTSNGYYNGIKSQAYNYVPYYYTFQWQETMNWVNTMTPVTAVFAHWWDYGYWVQTMGNRATVTDGGNNIVYWSYLIGRYVLTGDNQKESLEFLYTHNVTNLLIDSSDIGKYGAFSQIGSDENFDRLSSGPVIMISDQKNILETKEGFSRIYQGGNYLDEDIQYNNTNLFKENSAIIAIELNVKNNTYQQPIGIFYNSGLNIRLPLRYIYFNNTLTDYKEGINAVAYPIQNIVQGSNNQLSIDPTGGLIYLSPRVFKGFLGQVYILNDPLDNFPAFKVIHIQPDYILQMISSQNGVNLGEFAIYQGIKGPIKIWNITYPNNVEYIAKYNNPTFPPEINWTF